MKKNIDVFFGIGSNQENALGTPLWHLQQAVKALTQLNPNSQARVSSLYKSLPMGPADQPDYLNAVVAVTFTHDLQQVFSPKKLLAYTQGIEAQSQRLKKRHWGERSLDVDILLYGDEVLTSESLTIPHIGILERNFVCVPLLEIAPTITIKTKPLKDEPAAQTMQGLVRIKKDWLEP